MSIEVEQAQAQFIRAGGVHTVALMKARKNGIIPLEGEYSFQEYPQLIRVSLGKHDVPWTTETVKGVTLSGVKSGVELFQETLVRNEDEHQRVLDGGKTDSEIEDERQELIRRCQNEGIQVDRRWPTIRLRRELGDKVPVHLDSAPGDRLAALDSEIAQLKALVAKQAEIDALKAQLAGIVQVAPIAQPAAQTPAINPLGDHTANRTAQAAQAAPVRSSFAVETMKAKLTANGVQVKPGWDATRLADELAAIQQ